MLRITVLLSVFSLFISCTTFDENDVEEPSLSEVIVEDIEDMLASGSALAALQDIDYLDRQGRLSVDESARLREEALSKYIDWTREEIARRIKRVLG